MTTAYTAAPVNEAHEAWVRALFPDLIRADGSMRAVPVVVFECRPSCRVIERAPVTIPSGTPLYIGGCPHPEAWAGEGAPWWATGAASSVA